MEKEFRIGNKVISYDENWNEITATLTLICETHYRVKEHNSAMSWDLTKPIPITEEWLLKFGFERQDNNWKRLCICNDWTYLYWERLAGFELSVNKHSIMLPHIKYVHQLQNFIYCLTGEKL